MVSVLLMQNSVIFQMDVPITCLSNVKMETAFPTKKNVPNLTHVLLDRFYVLMDLAIPLLQTVPMKSVALLDHLSNVLMVRVLIQIQHHAISQAVLQVIQLNAWMDFVYHQNHLAHHF